MNNEKLEKAISLADRYLNSMSATDLALFFFDRTVDELMALDDKTIDEKLSFAKPSKGGV